MTTMVRMMEASTMLCKNKDKAVANIRMRMIGLLNWGTRSVKASERFGGFKRLAPNVASLFFASEVAKPLTFVCSFLSKSEEDMLQKERML
jgi:hypothetical protein